MSGIRVLTTLFSAGVLLIRWRDWISYLFEYRRPRSFGHWYLYVFFSSRLLAAWLCTHGSRFVSLSIIDITAGAISTISSPGPLSLALCLAGLTTLLGGRLILA